MLAIYLISLLYVTTNVHLHLIYDKFYYTISPKAVDYCLHYYHGDNDDYGCATDPDGNIGTLVYLENTTSVNDFMHVRLVKEKTKYITVISYEVYRNRHLIQKLISTHKFVRGIVLLEPTKRELKNFNCESHASCGDSDEYGYFKWPIPIILIKHIKSAQEKVMKCATLSKEKKTCAMEISYPQFSHTDLNDCSKKHYNYDKKTKQETKCEFLTGHNYYYAVFNPDVSNEMFVILYAYMDVNSIFEDSGYGSNRVIPVVAVLMNIIQLFQKFVKLLKYDILVAFIDNENVNDAGLTLLYEDLKRNRVKFSNKIFKTHDILFSIHLDSFSKLNNADFFITDNIVERNKLNLLNAYLKQSTMMFELKLFRLMDHHMHNNDVRIRELKVRKITDSCDDRQTFTKESFNDRYPFESRKIDIIRLSLLLIRTFEKILIKSDFPDDVHFKNIYVCLKMKNKCPVVNSSLYTTADDIKFGLYLFDCLTKNHTCSRLKSITSQLEKFFLDIFGNPFVCQEQRGKYIRNIPMTSRLSTMMKRVLIYRFGAPANMYYCKNKNPFHYILKVNNKLQCFFVNMIVHEGPANFTYTNYKGNIRHIYTYRTNCIEEPRVRLFKIPDSRSEAILLVTGTMMFTIAFLGVIFLREYSPESTYENSMKLLLADTTIS